MQADLFYQLLNPLVFIVFALGFFAIHKVRTDRSALLIGLSYIVGAVAFVSDLVFAQSDGVVIRTGVAGLYAMTTVLIIGGTNIYYRKDAPWTLLAVMIVVHLLLYAGLMIIKADWIRSLMVNFGVGLMFVVGLFRIRNCLTGSLDKLLFFVGVVNCAQCFVRPVGIALLSDGSHEESIFIISLHLFMAVSAIATAMSMFLVLGRDVFEDLQEGSHTDPLTGLLNRRGLEKKSAAFGGGTNAQPSCVIVADIDHFKAVNDTYGHAFGDQVIQSIGKLMQDLAPETGLSARLGGEEFLMFLPDTDLVQARQLAENLRRVFEATPLLFETELTHCTASFGIIQRHTNETLDEMMERADRALYLAKNEGRNCVRCEADFAIGKLRKLSAALQRHATPDASPVTTKSAR
jgi:diguanylate cyclase (GGDEF)-like protein